MHSPENETTYGFYSENKRYLKRNGGLFKHFWLWAKFVNFFVHIRRIGENLRKIRSNTFHKTLTEGEFQENSNSRGLFKRFSLTGATRRLCYHNFLSFVTLTSFGAIVTFVRSVYAVHISTIAHPRLG